MVAFSWGPVTWWNSGWSFQVGPIWCRPSLCDPALKGILFYYDHVDILNKWEIKACKTNIKIQMSSTVPHHNTQQIAKGQGVRAWHQGQKALLQEQGKGSHTQAALWRRKQERGLDQTRWAILWTRDLDYCQPELRQNRIILDVGVREPAPSTPPPCPQYSLLLLPVDSQALQWCVTIAPPCYSTKQHCTSLNDAEPWRVGAPNSPPPVLPPASGLWIQRTLLRLWLVLGRRQWGLYYRKASPPATPSPGWGNTQNIRATTWFVNINSSEWEPDMLK